MKAVESAIAEVPAIVGVAAKHLDTGQEIVHNADQTFFTASTFKVPLLVALYREVDAGNIDMSERIEINDELRVPGSGIMKEMASGMQPTLHDLATLMIIISDNMATDILYHKVGRDNIARLASEYHLNSTRIPMTTRQLLYSVVGLDVSNPEHDYALAVEKLTNRQFVDDADGFSEEKSDVSSPSDMSRLLELLYRGEVLSESSTKEALDILHRQQLTNVIPLLLPHGTRSAHKTGSYKGVRCDVGIVHSASGPYTIAIMAKQVDGERLAVDIALAKVSKAVHDTFNG